MKDQWVKFANSMLTGKVTVSEAAKKAGYSEKSAHVTGCRLLKNAKIIDYMKKKREKTSKKVDITRESQLERLNDIIEMAIKPKKKGEKRDLKAAIAANQEQNRLLGLHAPEKKKVEIEFGSDFGDGGDDL